MASNVTVFFHRCSVQLLEEPVRIAKVKQSKRSAGAFLDGRKGHGVKKELGNGCYLDFGRFTPFIVQHLRLILAIAYYYVEIGMYIYIEYRTSGSQCFPAKLATPLELSSLFFLYRYTNRISCFFPSGRQTPSTGPCVKKRERGSHRVSFTPKEFLLVKMSHSFSLSLLFRDTTTTRRHHNHISLSFFHSLTLRLFTRSVAPERFFTYQRIRNFLLTSNK